MRRLGPTRGRSVNLWRHAPFQKRKSRGLRFTAPRLINSVDRGSEKRLRRLGDALPNRIAFVIASGRTFLSPLTRQGGRAIAIGEFENARVNLYRLIKRHVHFVFFSSTDVYLSQYTKRTFPANAALPKAGICSAAAKGLQLKIVFWVSEKASP